MDADELRKIENFVLAQPLSNISAPENLQFLAYLLTDHDHLRIKLAEENNQERKRAKFEAMRPYLRFKAARYDTYVVAQAVANAGLQPIYDEQEAMETAKLFMPPSMVSEVR